MARRSPFAGTGTGTLPRRQKAPTAPPAGRWATEQELQDACLEAAQWRGWRVEHAWTSIHSAKGYPDATLIRDDRCIVVEFKSATGMVSDEQADWMADFAGAGVETYLVWPWDEDWFVDVILV